MRILLIGEYSRLHNSLKEGLLELNHEVKIIANSDGFKNFPVDYSTDFKICKTKIGNFFRQAFVRIFKLDLAKIEQGLRFYFHLNKLKNFDIVQFIHETPIKTNPCFELFLLKKIFKYNKKVFVLSCGVDYLNVTFDLENETQKSVLKPYLDNPEIKTEYNFVSEFLNKNHKKIHDFVFGNCNGVIATDFDYVPALKNHSKYLGLIANPINLKKLDFINLDYSEKIIIFLGINEWSYNQKGTVFFEKALEILKNKYGNKIEVIITKNIPYVEYINLYNSAHILLDQVFANDQGYNSLEAMAKGKLVFTGAENEFTNYYSLTEKVCINAKPDVDYLVSKLSFLIENPEEIKAIGKRARVFVEKEHHYIKIAEKYLDVWNKN
jgi:glycosyltransferase involved in cell wall biosynthesis